MTLFVINIGEEVDTYADCSIPLLQKLCKFNKINLFILSNNIKQNVHNVHPSWLKLFAHDIIDDDFIITWDLDLVPTHLYKLKDFFNTEKLNLSYDSAYILHNNTFNGKFKYNCGLMGIPKTYRQYMVDIYNKHAPNPHYTSYEQFFVNDTIYDNNTDVHLLDNRLNHLIWAGPVEDKLNLHYTHYNPTNFNRTALIQHHFERFKSNFNY